MYAALKTAGTQPVVSERLNSSVKKGARTLMTDLSVRVGMDQERSTCQVTLGPQRPLRR